MAEARRELERAVERSAIDRWPATWQQTLDELNIRDDFGTALVDEVLSILRDNEMTPQAAATEVSTISNRVGATIERLTQLIDGLQGFGLSAEVLAPGDAEVMVTIPRSFVSNNLPELAREFAVLRRVLGPFEEVETGSRAPFEVRAIASSDFGLFLAAAPMVAASIAKAVDWTLDAYLKLIQIREARQRLLDEGIPAEALGQVDEHADLHMRREIENYVDQYLESREGRIESGRANELRADLTMSMSAIANRIDEGFNFDVRVGTNPVDETADDDSEPGPDDAELEAAVRSVEEIAPRLKYVNRTGQRLLSLPEVQAPNAPTADA